MPTFLLFIENKKANEEILKSLFIDVSKTIENSTANEISVLFTSIYDEYMEDAQSFLDALKMYLCNEKCHAFSKKIFDSYASLYTGAYNVGIHKILKEEFYDKS